MSLRDEMLRINRGDVDEAAAYLALRLTRSDPENFKAGYSIPNAIHAAREQFPEVSEDRIRYINRWGVDRMRHPVSEAAVAIDDVEGFWTQGRDLTEEELIALNESLQADKGTVIREDAHRWLITLGRGFTYLVEPVLTCSSCGQRLWIDEVNPYHPDVHSACYDRREP